MTSCPQSPIYRVQVKDPAGPLDLATFWSPEDLRLVGGVPPEVVVAAWSRRNDAAWLALQQPEAGVTGPVDLFDSTYGHFGDDVHVAVRRETFGQDIGQNSWLTVDEYDRFLSWLELTPEHHVLEVACGSGGPARYLAEQAGCRVTGLDANASGIATAVRAAAESGAAGRLAFRVADATATLPLDDGSVNALVCIDSMNHFPERVSVFQEWRRVLRPGGRALFTDPVVITGPVTNMELAQRSSIGLFLFVPPKVNERLLAEAGLRLLRREDVSDNAAAVAARWHDARQRHAAALLPIEGQERFDGLQSFFAAVHRLTSERRLSRMAYLVQKPGA